MLLISWLALTLQKWPANFPVLSLLVMLTFVSDIQIIESNRTIEQFLCLWPAPQSSEEAGSVNVGALFGITHHILREESRCRFLMIQLRLSIHPGAFQIWFLSVFRKVMLHVSHWAMSSSAPKCPHLEFASPELHIASSSTSIARALEFSHSAVACEAARFRRSAKMAPNLIKIKVEFRTWITNMVLKPFHCRFGKSSRHFKFGFSRRTGFRIADRRLAVRGDSLKKPVLDPCPWKSLQTLRNLAQLANERAVDHHSR
jgi:hypothetical protein